MLPPLPSPVCTIPPGVTVSWVGTTAEFDAATAALSRAAVVGFDWYAPRVGGVGGTSRRHFRGDCMPCRVCIVNLVELWSRLLVFALS